MYFLWIALFSCRWIGLFIFGSQTEKFVELLHAHILPELGGVNVVAPVVPGTGNRISKGKKATLETDPHKLIRFTQASGRIPHAPTGSFFSNYFPSRLVSDVVF